MAIIVTVDGSGPVFDGEWEPIMHTYQIRLEDKLGDMAVDRIRAYLPTQYMYLGHNGGDPINNPPPPDAGFLVAHIMAHRETMDSVMVTDGGYPAMIYGPWIEGVAPGNEYFGITGRMKRGLPGRFQGYHAFRRTADYLNAAVEDIATIELQPYLEALNDLPPGPPHRVPQHVLPGCVLGMASTGRERRPCSRRRALGRDAGRCSDGRAFGEYGRNSHIP